MVTAPYLYNRIPHSALKMGTSCKMFYGKDAGLSRIRIIGAGVFFHIKDANKLLSHFVGRNSVRLHPEREQGTRSC